MVIEKKSGESVFPGSPISKNMTRLKILLGIFPGYQLNLVITLTNADLQRNIHPETTRW